MLELKADAFHRAAPLFAGIEHNVPLVYSVLEGNSLGRIFVDCQETPTNALIFSDVGYSYLGGTSISEAFGSALVRLFFDKILPAMEEKELILFAFSDAWRDKLDALLRPRGAIIIERKIFSFNPDRFAAHAGWRAKIPEGFQIRLMDTALAKAHPSFAPLVGARSKRFGVCLLRDDEIISTCMAVCVGGGEVEIDINTPEVHQGQGYGYLTACAFIEESLVRGLVPSWACWPYRAASQALAQKLGFETRPDALAHFWAETM